MSEQFRVVPQDLNGYSDQIDRNAGFVREAHSYLANHGSKTDEMQGLLSGIVSGYQPVLDWQLNILESMKGKLPRTADALQETAATYKRIDEESAEKLDQAYRSTQQ